MNKIKEPAREGFLYHLWLNRSFEKYDLTTHDGHTVEIIEKGIRNYDAGPDFLNALVRLDGELLRGDIEIHSIAGDWYAHGHHRDPRYNNVILHVVTMSCPANFRTLLENGTNIPALNLDDYLEKTAEELELYSDLKDGPALIQCSLRDKEPHTIRTVLEQAGEKRLMIKAARFAERRTLDSWDQLFYCWLCEALGYSKNQIPFRRLAIALPVETLWQFIWNDPPNVGRRKCEAFLFGGAGLLPEKWQHEKDKNSYEQELLSYWHACPLRAKIDILKPESWQFFRLRPQNFPTRRIAAAAEYVQRFMSKGFVESLTHILYNRAAKPHKIFSELEKLFVIETPSYWASHYSFSEAMPENRSAKKSRLIGKERARDIVINVALPGLLAYAQEADDHHLENKIMNIFERYPRLSDNEITRKMRKQLFGYAKGGSDCVKRACQQQGLVHLRKQVCVPEQCDHCLKLMNGHAFY